MKTGFKVSDNGKTKFRASHRNTFGLNFGLPKNGGTCPGATCGKGGCLDVRDGKKRQTCYMAKITAIYKNVGVVLEHNTKLVTGKTIEEIKDVCRKTIQIFIQKSKGEDLYFRLHYSGDFFSEEYTKAWAEIINEFPNVTFWGYTRSTSLVKHLIGLPNLSLYLSCDLVNIKDMLQVYEEFKDKTPRLALAWLGDNAPDPTLHRWVKCPEVTGKVKNTKDAGACSKCRLCVDNFKIRLKNIQFPIH